MMKRKPLSKASDKTFIRFIGKEKSAENVHIFRRDDKQELERIKNYAIENELDILAYPNIISLNPEEWRMYNRGQNISIKQANIYELDTLFIDIDIPLYENYYSFRKALKESGINNYQTYESATGNIHLYIKVQKFSDIEQYRGLVQTIGNYLATKGIEIDTHSSNPIQKTYLEGFRVLSKNNFSSRYIKELSHKGEVQTAFQVFKAMKQRGIKIEKEYSSKYAMHILKEEIENNYSGELHLTELERKYLIPRYTLSRSLKRLQEFKAIEYRTMKGSSGYIQVISYNENRFIRCIEEQLTRKQNFFYINILEVFRVLKNIYLHIVHECCKYIEKNIIDFREFVRCYISGCYVQGLFSGSSGSFRDRNPEQGYTGERIKQGNRNTTLFKALVKGRYRGLEDTELEQLAFDIHSSMETGNKPFTRTEVQSVLKWVKGITIYSNTF